MLSLKQNAAMLALSIFSAFIPAWFILPEPMWVAVTAITAFVCALTIQILLLRSRRSAWQALEVGLLNFKDGEFSTAIHYQADNELGQLCQLFNDTAVQLRQEKQWLYQRELMLDKVLETSPQVLVLVDSNDRVIFANSSAKTFFNHPHRLEGERFSALLNVLSSELKQAASKRLDGLFSMATANGETHMWHLANGELLLNNHYHHLYIFKQFTRELSRQEVQVWKKVIRIISHELNNSLGPISSMLHSGQILSQRLAEPKLSRVFATIEERINHLSEFVQGYGKFAKLPPPKLQSLDLYKLCSALQQQWSFRCELQQLQITADEAQLEQLLINLIKNATESGSEVSEITVAAMQQGNQAIIHVMDRGEGMSDAVMANALIPFYSTKSSGTGLGLALCREIVEAHHGQISLFNRKDKGLCVEVRLPNPSNIP